MTWIVKTAATALILVLASCGSPDNKYFTLSTEAPMAPPTTAAARTVSVDEVTIPSYLDRPQIVIRQDANRADIREYERWMEPLDSMLRRVLAADLATRLGSGRVLDRPGKDTTLITVNIDAFGQEGDRVVLRGQWTVKTAGKDGPGVSHSFSREEPLGKAEMPDMVAALSRLVGGLADEVALIGK
jgi:uncharacterized lipoprotein YmbA